MLTALTDMHDVDSNHRLGLQQYHPQTGGMFRALTIRSMSAAFAHEPRQRYGSKATSAALNMSVMIVVSSTLTDISYICSTHRLQLWR